jgi:FkbM family methyltransferase
MEQKINKMKLVFDIGANRGNMTNFFIEESERVVCFEPNLELLSHIRNRFSSIIDKQIFLDCRGLSDKEETKTFRISNADTISTFSEDWINNSRFTGSHNWDKSVEVKTTTLDNIIDEYGIPDFVKIDVEGYELEVIKGLTKMLDSTTFSFEWAEEQYEKMKEIYEYLNNLGYMNFSFTYGDDCTYGDGLVWKSWNDLDIHNDIDPARKYKWGMIYFKK